MAKRLWLSEIPVDIVSIKTIAGQLIGLVKNQKTTPCMVAYLNAHNFNLASKTKKLQRIFKKATLVYADGWGIVWAARILGGYLPGRLTAKDFFADFCQVAQKRGLKIFFLGGEQKVLDKMLGKLREKYPDLRIVGAASGYFNPQEEEVIIGRINRVRPDFLVVGMGTPKQEYWLAGNLDRLKVKVAWCVGGLFDFVSGSKPACPRLLGDLGFEWLFRLITEPKRLWRRYLPGGFEFLVNVVRIKIAQK
jgi:N-acetylglucosaminyldiphosphoundecaprenol N-acetyl-beta-D-mannosaminyltransferase